MPKAYKHKGVLVDELLKFSRGVREVFKRTIIVDYDDKFENVYITIEEPEGDARFKFDSLADFLEFRTSFIEATRYLYGKSNPSGR